MLFTAIAFIGYYSQPSFEFGYTIKYMRILLLILVAFLNIWGLILGLIITFILIITNKTVTKKGYFYPIIPFNLYDFKRIFLRKKNS